MLAEICALIVTGITGKPQDPGRFLPWHELRKHSEELDSEGGGQVSAEEREFVLAAMQDWLARKMSEESENA